MNEFFATRQEWTPLFRSMVEIGRSRATAAGGGDAAASTNYGNGESSCQASSYIGGTASAAAVRDDEEDAQVRRFDLDTADGPWRLLDAVPENDDDRDVIAKFLDSMHRSLLDIPVTESKQDDDNDLQFIEEGRRMLAISRFHVLRGPSSSGAATGKSDPLSFSSSSSSSPIEVYDALFSTCWSELMHLTSDGSGHAGSIILLPDHALSDVRRFADMNLLRPLQWLGLHEDWEISSLERDSPAIRLIYRLDAIPDLDDKPSFDDGGDDDEVEEKQAGRGFGR